MGSVPDHKSSNGHNVIYNAIAKCSDQFEQFYLFCRYKKWSLNRGYKKKRVINCAVWLINDHFCTWKSLIFSQFVLSVNTVVNLFKYC